MSDENELQEKGAEDFTPPNVEQKSWTEHYTPLPEHQAELQWQEQEDPFDNLQYDEFGSPILSPGTDPRPYRYHFDSDEIYEKLVQEHDRKQAVAEQAMVNVIGQAMQNQGLNYDMEDPHGNAKMQLGKEIRELGDRAFKARAEGRFKEALDLELRIQNEWKRLEQIPVHPAINQAEKNNVAALAHTWVFNSNNPESFNSLVNQFGGEKMLEQARIIRDEFNRLSDGTTFAIIRGDSGIYGGKQSITADDLRVINVGDQQAADDIRYLLSTGNYNLEELLLQKGFIARIDDELKNKPTKKAQKQSGRVVDAPHSAARNISKAPAPIRPTGSGSRAVNIKNPDDMTQKEYEAWRKKGGGR